MDYKNLDVYVKCPFYLRNGAVNIVCEGINSNVVSHQFETVEAKGRYLGQFCCVDYKKCPYYQALEKIYNEQEDHG